MSRVRNIRGQEQRSLILSRIKTRGSKIHEKFSKLPKRNRSNLYGIYEMIQNKVEDEG